MSGPTPDPSRPPPPAILVQRLSHTYPPPRRRRHSRGPSQHTGPRLALDDVTLEVAPGETVAILGPNGSGKSTLLRVLATLMTPKPPGPGRVEVLGVDVLAHPAAARAHLGVVFQHPSLDDQLTARENLTLHARLHGILRDETAARVTQALDNAGLTDRGDERVERYSGGMRRRLELARATLHRPRILLMDEPTTGLDPDARDQWWANLSALREANGEGEANTILFTTHLMDEADAADRVAIFHEGRLHALDTPAALKAEVGGDVITLDPAPGTDAVGLAASLGPDAAAVNGHVRIEVADGPAAIADIAARAAGRFSRLTLAHPTLADAFTRITGGTLTHSP